MTYYKILQYLKKNGLDDGKAHYVRNMIRELVNDKGGCNGPIHQRRGTLGTDIDRCRRDVHRQNQN